MDFLSLLSKYKKYFRYTFAKFFLVPYQVPNYYGQWEYDAWVPNQISYPDYENNNNNEYIGIEISIWPNSPASLMDP